MGLVSLTWETKMSLSPSSAVCPDPDSSDLGASSERCPHLQNLASIIPCINIWIAFSGHCDIMRFAFLSPQLYYKF